MTINIGRKFKIQLVLHCSDVVCWNKCSQILRIVREIHEEQNILFSRKEKRDTWEKIHRYRYLPRKSFLWETTHLKGEGQGIYILKTPSRKDLPETSTSVIFLNPLRILGSRIMPLEQLTVEYIVNREE